MKKLLIYVFFLTLNSSLTLSSYSQEEKSLSQSSVEQNQCYSMPLFIHYQTLRQKSNSNDYISFVIKKKEMGERSLNIPSEKVYSHLDHDYYGKIYYSKKKEEFVLMMDHEIYFLGNNRPAKIQHNLYLQILPKKGHESTQINPENFEVTSFLYLSDCSLERDNAEEELKKTMSQCNYYRLNTNYQTSKANYKGFALYKANNPYQEGADYDKDDLTPYHLIRNYNFDVKWNAVKQQFILIINGKSYTLFLDTPVFFQKRMFIKLSKSSDLYTDDLEANPDNLEKSYFLFLGDCN